MTRVIPSGKYVGEEMMLTDHIRENSASSMGYLDVFKLDRADVYAELDSGKFPLLQVRGHATAYNAVNARVPRRHMALTHTCRLPS